ncbi:hypothetical protein [Microbacterium gorillae]|uniref:hypothetical protein n=1 Tax=Microbacterium gorillae TaxID=1231063 RepID=UPI003D96A667
MDDDFTARLNAMVAPPDARLATAARDVARAATHRQPRRWFVPLIVVGAVVLTGAASATALGLNSWPFVQLPDGASRTSVPIPLVFTTIDGEQEECGGYVELSQVTPEQIRALNDDIAARDWSGFGQSLYDNATGAPVPGDPNDGEERVGEGFTRWVPSFVTATIPDAAILPGSDLALEPPTDVPLVEAWGFSCVPGVLG